MIRELDRVHLMLQPNGGYIAIHDESTRIKELLSSLDILPADLDVIAGEVSERATKAIVSQVRVKPAHERKVRRSPGRPRKQKAQEDRPRRKPGRPRKEPSPASGEPKEKGKPGRPKGSKNKKKTVGKPHGKSGKNNG
jgi:hypothetical protein